MNEFFEQNRDRLTDAEKRRVWTAMHDEIEKDPGKKRGLWFWLPTTVTAGAVAVVAVMLLGPQVMQRGATDEMAALRETPRAVEAPAPIDGVSEERVDSDALEFRREALGSSASPSEPEESGNAVLLERAEEDESAPVEAQADPKKEVAAAKPQSRQLADNEKRSVEREKKIDVRTGLLRGRVTAADGSPVAFASVLVLGTTRAGTTDEDGYFAITDVPRGKQTIRVIALDYAPGELAMTLGDEDEFLAAVTLQGVESGQLFGALLDADGRIRGDLSESDPAFGNSNLLTQTVDELIGQEKVRTEGEHATNRERDKKDDDQRRDPGLAGPVEESAGRGSGADLAQLPVDTFADKNAPVRSVEEQNRPGGKSKDELAKQNEPSDVVAQGGQREFRGGRAGEVQAQIDGIPPNDKPSRSNAEAEARRQSTERPEVAIAPAPAPSTRPQTGQPIPVGGTDPVNDVPFDAMFFEHYGVNPFVDPAEDRFATFAVDVDNASFTLARTYLQSGNLPPADAVRVEEFINSFDHAYPAPGGALTASHRPVPSKRGTFAIYLDAAPSPFGKGKELLRIGLKGREIDAANRKPAVLTFLVDVSGSMARENRLGLVKQALGLLLDQMRPSDQVALVVYGSNARVLLPHTSLEERWRIEQAIAALNPEGATNAEAGLIEAYRLADRSFQSNCINRVILCSDGVANVGNTGADSILEKIKRQARRGIELTAVGFGMGNYNDVLMEKLANQGDGNYYYVDELKQARKVFVENLTGTLQTIAKDVKIQVEFDPKVIERYRLVGYENRDVADKDFRNDLVDAGEVGAGHEVTALFEVKRRDASGRKNLATVRIRYEDPETGRVTEEERSLQVRELSESWNDADASFRMDAATAEFAEILRHSYWAKDASLGHALGLAHAAAWEMGSPEDVRDIVEAMGLAARIWPKDQPPTQWRDDPRFEDNE